MSSVDPTASIFDPQDNRFSDDITENILSMLDLEQDELKKTRTVSKIFASGALNLMNTVVKIDPISKSIDDAIRKFRNFRKKHPTKMVEILIPDTSYYTIGSHTINGMQLDFQSHQVTTLNTSNYSSLDFLPQDLTLLKIKTPELELTLNGTTYDVKWLLDQVPVFAFQNCTRLRKISFPPTLLLIDAHAFENCPNLENLHLEHTRLQVIGEVAFARTGVIQVLLPPSLGVIEFSAFRSCRNLTSVTFAEDSMTKIRHYAFTNCTNNVGMQLLFPEAGCISISYRSFVNCNILTVEITPAVCFVEKEAFFNCDNLEIAFIDRRVRLGSVSDRAFPAWTIVEHMSRCNFGSCVLQLRF